MLWKKMTHGTPEVVGIRRWIPERLLDESPVLRLLTEKPRLALMPFDMKIH
jgi:hypothetical protein